MIDYEKEFGKPGYALGSRQTQIATTFKIVYGWMCAGLATRRAPPICTNSFDSLHGRSCPSAGPCAKMSD